MAPLFFAPSRIHPADRIQFQPNLWREACGFLGVCSYRSNLSLRPLILQRPGMLRFEDRSGLKGPAGVA